VRDEWPQVDVPIALRDLIQAGDARDVNQDARRADPALQLDEEVCAAGDDASLFTILGEDLKRDLE